MLLHILHSSHPMLLTPYTPNTLSLLTPSHSSHPLTHHTLHSSQPTLLTPYTPLTHHTLSLLSLLTPYTHHTLHSSLPTLLTLLSLLSLFTTLEPHYISLLQMLYKASTFAGFVGILTGMKPHYFTISMNERRKCVLIRNFINQIEVNI